MSPVKVVRVLRHGTTAKRAASIVQTGPNPHFVEPGGSEPARGFSTYPVGAPICVGTPKEYANGKARLFPEEGGPAVVEVEVPFDIAALGIDAGGEVRFELGYGLDELLRAWPVLTKRIVLCL